MCHLTFYISWGPLDAIFAIDSIARGRHIGREGELRNKLDHVYLVHYCTLSLFDIWVTRQSAEWEPPIWLRNTKII